MNFLSLKGPLSMNVFAELMSGVKELFENHLRSTLSTYHCNQEPQSKSPAAEAAPLRLFRLTKENVKQQIKFKFT